MAYKVEVINLNEAVKRLQEIPQDKINDLLAKSGVMVMDEAKKRVPASTGVLRNSIKCEVSDGVCAIGTNIGYAPYVEYGTGKFAKDGNGRAGWWVFVKGQDSKEKSDRKIYTYEEACRIWHYLVSLGYPPEQVWITQGQKPQPFLEPALREKEKDIIELFKKALEENSNGKL